MTNYLISGATAAHGARRPVQCAAMSFRDELERLPHDARVRRVLAINRAGAAAATSAVGEAASIAELAQGDAFARRLALAACFHTRDGAAVLRGLADPSRRTPITELTIDEKLAEARARRPGYVGPSFATIAAFNANGAMPHYRATPESHATIEGDGLLLIDEHAIDGLTLRFTLNGTSVLSRSGVVVLHTAAVPGTFEGILFGEGDGAQLHEESAEIRTDDWNELEVEIEGNCYAVTLNGKSTSRFVNVDSYRGKSTEDDSDSGFVGLLHRKGRIHLKDVEFVPREARAEEAPEQEEAPEEAGEEAHEGKS